jgi:hypothetical protein
MSGVYAADATSASVAKLRASLGNTSGFEVDEVRITGDGIACIDYRTRAGDGAQSKGHAVVQGDEVLRNATDSERFEKAWNDHCLGPRGGMTPNE